MNKLAKYIIGVAIAAIVGFIAWYFKDVLIYILVAAVVALIGKPLMTFFKKVRIKKYKIPNWLSALISLLIILTIFISLFFLFAPIVGKIIHQLNNIDFEVLAEQISGPLHNINTFIINTFPSVGDNFKLEVVALEQIKGMVNISMFSNIVNSLASFIVDFSVALFSIVFISFFFLLEEGMFTNMIVAAFPDKYEENIRRASTSISNLLSRYFMGISIESLCITVLNGVGLIFIAKMNPTLAITVAFISGVLNVIPYVGPLAGDIIAVTMGLITHFSSGVSTSMGIYLLIILAIFVVTQLIDNYIFQPLIYSNSVKAHPLEIFIVILMAGHIGGILGMLIAIPSYTVIRVIANEFLSRFKIVQKLTRGINKKE